MATTTPSRGAPSVGTPGSRRCQVATEQLISSPNVLVVARGPMISVPHGKASQSFARSVPVDLDSWTIEK